MLAAFMFLEKTISGVCGGGVENTPSQSGRIGLNAKVILC